MRTIALKPEFRRGSAIGMMVISLAGCAEVKSELDVLLGEPVFTEDTAGAAAQTPDGPATAETLDTTTEAERIAAARPASAGRALGQTVASLGSPAEAGFWLKTPLVEAETPGVVTVAATGRSASVTLIPIDGPATAGSRISLAAMRVLEVPLTDLVELSVRRGG